MLQICLGRGETERKIFAMNMIVNVDQNWAIGLGNRLLVRIPSDMKFFREVTTGKVVVCGRRTLETFPNGMPLKNRTNIVLSTNPGFTVKDALVCRSVPELLEELKKYDSDDVYVVGGASLYRQLLPYCSVVHVTKVEHAFEADAWFPNLDKMPEWRITGDSDEQTYFDLTFHFFRYEKSLLTHS